MGDWLGTFWNGLSSEVQAAMVGAAVTVLTATGGALLVVWQMGRQARDTLTANRETERQSDRS
jgi:hypothetical protein